MNYFLVTHPNLSVVHMRSKNISRDLYAGKARDVFLDNKITPCYLLLYCFVRG